MISQGARIRRTWIDLKALADRRDALWIVVLALASMVAALVVVLAVVALLPRPHVLVPSALAPSVILPDAVTDEAAGTFALVYILSFDNYTPATIESAAAVLKTRVAPQRWSEVADDLDRRTRVILEGRMSAHTIPRSPIEVSRPGGGSLRVRVPASRRLFIADRLSRESEVVYELVLEPCALTPANPHGLAVVAQSVEESHEKHP